MIHESYRVTSIQKALKVDGLVTILGKLEDLLGKVEAELLALVVASVLLCLVILWLIRLGTNRRRTITVVLSASS